MYFAPVFGTRLLTAVIYSRLNAREQLRDKFNNQARNAVENSGRRASVSAVEFVTPRSRAEDTFTDDEGSSAKTAGYALV